LAQAVEKNLSLGDLLAEEGETPRVTGERIYQMITGSIIDTSSGKLDIPRENRKLLVALMLSKVMKYYEKTIIMHQENESTQPGNEFLKEKEETGFFAQETPLRIAIPLMMKMQAEKVS